MGEKDTKAITKQLINFRRALSQIKSEPSLESRVTPQNICVYCIWMVNFKDDPVLANMTCQHAEDAKMLICV